MSHPRAKPALQHVTSHAAAMPHGRRRRPQSAHLGAEEHVVGALHAQHEGVVLVADLVLVAAEATAAPDAMGAQEGQRLRQHCIPAQAGRWVAMLQPPAMLTAAE